MSNVRSGGGPSYEEILVNYFNRFSIQNPTIYKPSKRFKFTLRGEEYNWGIFSVDSYILRLMACYLSNTGDINLSILQYAHHQLNEWYALFIFFFQLLSLFVAIHLYFIECIFLLIYKLIKMWLDWNINSFRNKSRVFNQIIFRWLVIFRV